MRISIAVSHTPWIPERVTSMLRLEESLGEDVTHTHHTLGGERKGCVAFEVFGEKAPNHVWSERMWTWAAAQDAEWCVFLQDDTVVCPSFVDRVCGLLEEAGGDVVGLQVAHPAAVPLAEEGISWFTTSDALVGVAYAIRREALTCFLHWRSTRLSEGALEAISEDTLVGLWAMTSARAIWHPIPTLVDHDTSIVSVYGNDEHPNRRSRVRWDNHVIGTEKSSRIPHLGRFYEATPELARKWVSDLTEVNIARFTADNGNAEARRINYARRARGSAPKYRVLVATPTRGAPHPQYMASVWRLLKDEEVELLDPVEICDVHQWSSDVVRVRSRYVSYFLNQTDATHLLFLDDDIEMLPKVLRGMLRTGQDVVGAPYPRRDGINWDRVRAIGDKPAEAVAYYYSVRPLGDTITLQANGLAEVEAIPMGCTLISRGALEAMMVCLEKQRLLRRDLADILSEVDTSEDEELDEEKRLVMKELTNHLRFQDEMPHTHTPMPSVAMFQLAFNENADGTIGLLSEDFSFCKRWRAMGGKVFMYLGDGSPVTHHGMHAYKGDIQAFGFKRG